VSTYKGYPREDGSVGTRNFVAVMASVICSTTPVQAIASRVPGSIAVVHPYGCAQVGDDLGQTRRSLIGVAANPNVAGTLIVGLGCENNQPDELAAMIEVPKPLDVIGIQALGGSDKVLETGVRIVSERVAGAGTLERRECDVATLNVGLLCFECDRDTKGLERVGALVDKLVALGARVCVGVDRTLAPAGEALAERAATERVASVLRAWGSEYRRRRWHGDQSDEAHQWTGEERARAEAIAAVTGTAEVRQVLGCSETSTDRGLQLMNVPSDPVEAMSGLVSGGATLLIVVSSRGILTGALGCPTLVVVPEGAAGPVVDASADWRLGSLDAESEVDALYARLLEVASGAPTRLEEVELTDFAISKVSTAF